MKIEDIIEGLNKHIEDRRALKGIKNKGHLVLHKEITSHSSFKAYKCYRYTIWFANKGKLYKVMHLQLINRVLEGQEEIIEKDMNVQISKMIFDWMHSDLYNQIILGEYKGYDTEDRNE